MLVVAPHHGHLVGAVGGQSHGLAALGIHHIHIHATLAT